MPSECPLDRVAEAHGTPTHVLDLRVLRDNAVAFARQLRNAFPGATPLYSVKTNYLPIVVKELAALGYGADVVSGPELELARRLNVPPSLIVFNGPHKTIDELRLAVQSGILVNLDSLDEAKLLNSLAGEMSVKAAVGLRVNPGLSVYGSQDPTFTLMAERSASESKFGYSIRDGEALAVLKCLTGMPHLAVKGLHCHLGSQVTSTPLLSRALTVFLQFAATASELAPIDKLTKLNIGGGFGVPGIARKRTGPLYNLLDLHDRPQATNESSFDLADLLSRLQTDLAEYGLNHMNIYCEPGRLIVSNAMVLVTRVSAVKRTGGVDWIIVDAGLNLLPTLAMQETHRIECVRTGPSRLKPFRVGGPLCYEGDVVGTGCMLPADITAGDLIVIHDSGAYSVSRSTNFIRPRASVVAWDGESARLCWRRETFDDMFAFDTGYL